MKQFDQKLLTDSCQFLLICYTYTAYFLCFRSHDVYI